MRKRRKFPGKSKVQPDPCHQAAEWSMSPAPQVVIAPSNVAWMPSTSWCRMGTVGNIYSFLLIACACVTDDCIAHRFCEQHNIILIIHSNLRKSLWKSIPITLVFSQVDLFLLSVYPFRHSTSPAVLTITDAPDRCSRRARRGAGARRRSAAGAGAAGVCAGGGGGG